MRHSTFALGTVRASLIGYAHDRFHVVMVSSRTHLGQLVFPNGRVRFGREGYDEAARRRFEAESGQSVHGAISDFTCLVNPPGTPRTMTLAKYANGVRPPAKLAQLEFPVVCLCDFVFSAAVSTKLRLNEALQHGRREVILVDARKIAPELVAKGHDQILRAWVRFVEKGTLPPNTMRPMTLRRRR